jgi:hypothetical protein
MKVVSGSLDVLETVGKRTFDVCYPIVMTNFAHDRIDVCKVINEADPELKGARRLLSKPKQPTLSEVRVSIDRDETTIERIVVVTCCQMY